MGLPDPAASGAAMPEFTTLVRQHQGMVYSLAYYFLRDRTAAEELAQDVFLQLYLHLGELESPRHVVFWLRRVTANRCISEARRRQRHPEVPLDEASEPLAPELAGDPVLSERLRRLLASLPEKPRMVLLLRYQEDLDPEDIAKLMQEPVNTVKSQLQRGLTMLRQKLGSMKVEK